jgi:hypothetical protein
MFVYRIKVQKSVLIGRITMVMDRKEGYCGGRKDATRWTGFERAFKS